MRQTILLFYLDTFLKNFLFCSGMHIFEQTKCDGGIPEIDNFFARCSKKNSREPTVLHYGQFAALKKGIFYNLFSILFKRVFFLIA